MAPLKAVVLTSASMTPFLPGAMTRSHFGTVQPQLGFTCVNSRSARPRLATLNRYLSRVPCSTVPASWVVSRTSITAPAAFAGAGAPGTGPALRAPASGSAARTGPTGPASSPSVMPRAGRQ